MKIFFWMINMIMMIIFALVSVAFLTLLERKILSIMQSRIGPNKVGIYGIFQPFSDAIKLYTKEFNKPFNANKNMFIMFPMIMIFSSFLLWMLMPFLNSFIMMNLGLMFFICILGFSVYSTLFMGWSSNSNYSNIGSIRAIAQTISYEISLTFIILTLFVFGQNFNFYWLYLNQKFCWNMIFLPITFMWLLTCLAELNRTPFDLAEAESELVSGFNTEFSGGKFAIIFMAEYMMIIVLSSFSSMILLGSNFKSFFFFFNSSLIMFFIIWARATLPRIRYDKLMNLTWKVFLPSSLMLLFMFFIIFWSITII